MMSYKLRGKFPFIRGRANPAISMHGTRGASAAPTPDSSFEKWRGALGDEMMVVAFIDRPLQSCHFVNIGGAAKVPDDMWPELKTHVTADYKAPSRAIAHDLAAGVVSDDEAELPSATAEFTGDFGGCIAHLGMPITHRRTITTTQPP